MNENFIIFDENENEEYTHYKIENPSIKTIKSLKIKFNESYDKLVLFEYEFGIHDINAHVSKISFVKNEKLFVFFEYDNPEHSSYSTLLFDEDNFFQDNFISCQDFFKESLSIKLSSNLSQKNKSKRNKI